ncbi:MAG: VOC family protein [Burkholderiaceae bacterium]
MTIRKLAHFSVRTMDLDASRRFYVEILGLHEGYRPPFDFPGAWLYRGGDEADYGTVHLIGIDPESPEGLSAYLGDRARSDLQGSGAVDHLAFLANDLAGMRERLRAAGLNFRERTVPSLNLHQLFVTDPSGLVVELNYEAAEAAGMR